MILIKFLYKFFFSEYILFLFYNLFQYNSQSIINEKHPKVKLLPSGNYFIIYDKGIIIYNYKFSLNKSIYNFTSEEEINDNDYEKTVISDFKNNNSYYIISLTKGKYFLYLIIIIIN